MVQSARHDVTQHLQVLDDGVSPDAAIADRAKHPRPDRRVAYTDGNDDRGTDHGPAQVGACVGQRRFVVTRLPGALHHDDVVFGPDLLEERLERTRLER